MTSENVKIPRIYIAGDSKLKYRYRKRQVNSEAISADLTRHLRILTPFHIHNQHSKFTSQIPFSSILTTLIFLFRIPISSLHSRITVHPSVSRNSIEFPEIANNKASSDFSRAKLLCVWTWEISHCRPPRLSQFD